MADLSTYNWDASADRVEALARRFYPLLLGASYEAANDLLPVDVAFDISNPLIKKTIDGLAKSIRGVAETTKEDVRRIVDAGTERGLSIGEIAKQIREKAPDMSKSRAATIARTESAAAYSKGSLLAYSDAGVEQSEWLVGGDPCPLCAPLSGKRAKLGKEFAEGVAHPPVHPACTCAIAPVVT